MYLTTSWPCRFSREYEVIRLPYHFGVAVPVVEPIVPM
jgi:hypothetical protein